MEAFACAAGSTHPVFLADPSWSQAQRAVLSEHLRQAAGSPAGDRGWLMIPSGGTSGRLKFARHDQDTIAAAVAGFQAHFGTALVNCVGVLPLHHVSGLMAWMRSALTGGAYLPWDWKRLEAGDLPPIAGPGRFISLVPTQLQRLLGNPGTVAWLRGFRAIFVGGGPSWPDLTEAAARARLPISLGYGMTETAAMVTALRPQEFLSGRRDSGTALPHARVGVAADGLIRIEGESLFRGYFPERDGGAGLLTQDLGAVDAEGRLTVLGRRDDVIITGGRKVDPREVEAALMATGLFTDVAVMGVPDAEWGQTVVACHPGADRPTNPAGLASALGGLAGFKRPRRYVPVEDWPRNAQGKVNRAALIEAARRSSPGG
jgi:O-succinylbenzoic acid--CoA ligase